MVIGGFVDVSLQSSRHHASCCRRAVCQGPRWAAHDVGRHAEPRSYVSVSLDGGVDGWRD